MRRAQETKLNLPAPQSLDLRGGGHLVEGKFHPGVMLAEETHGTGQEIVHRRADVADGETPGLSPRHLAHAAFHALGFRQQTARIVKQRLARRREHQPALDAIEQRRAEFILKMADLQAQRRLCHAQPFRSAAKVQFFGHRHESIEGVLAPSGNNAPLMVPFDAATSFRCAHVNRAIS